MGTAGGLEVVGHGFFLVLEEGLLFEFVPVMEDLRMGGGRNTLWKRA